MAPSKASQRRGPQQPSEHLYTLGERGRKTGVTLRDTGVRDEHGMQPLDDIFSSPDKDDDSDYGEADMDLTTASGPGPASLINGQNGNRLPFPRSRSPVKTYLKSPAVRNPNLGPTSSPMRGTVITSPQSNRGQSVKRKLDFSMESTSALKPGANGLPTKSSKVNGVNGVTNGYHSDEEEQDDEEAILHGQEEGDDSMQMIDDGGGDYDEPELNGGFEEQEDDSVVEEETVSKAAALPKKRIGRPPKVKTSAPKQSDRSPKRGRPARESLDSEDAAEESEQPQAKRQRIEAKGKGQKAAKADGSSPKEDQQPKKRGRKRKSDGAQDTSVLVQRAPPLPKGRGLVINRAASTTTRSGRTSIQPLQFWKNERVEYDRDDVFEDAVDGRNKKKHNRFVLPAIKEIVRVEDEEAPPRPRARKAPGRRPKRRASSDDEEDEEVEPWEREEGDIEGDILVWHPEHEFSPPGEDDEVEAAREQIALAGGAIETKEVRGATFGFAKTLSMPFFGSGVVDLPPGSEKRPKNSRKMHMTFFVYSGRVQVSVANTEFRISKGGMWFVPRGNYYSIVNDYDKPARIFFAQGCEILTSVEPPEDE